MIRSSADTVASHDSTCPARFCKSWALGAASAPRDGCGRQDCTCGVDAVIGATRPPARWNKAAEREKFDALGRSNEPSPFHAEPQRQSVIEFLKSRGFIPDGSLLVKSWSTRSGWDCVDLEFYPLARHASDEGWDAIIGCHASGENPRMLLGTCETLADVQMVYETVRVLNGYKGADGNQGAEGHAQATSASAAQD